MTPALIEAVLVALRAGDVPRAIAMLEASLLTMPARSASAVRMAAKRARDKRHIVTSLPPSHSDVTSDANRLSLLPLARASEISSDQKISKSSHGSKKIRSEKDSSDAREESDVTYPVTSDASHRITFDLIVDRFSGSRVEANGAPFKTTRLSYLPTEEAVQWFNERPDPARELERSLGGFFADPFQRKCGFAFQTWAQDPGRWLTQQAKRLGRAEADPHESFGNDELVIGGAK